MMALRKQNFVPVDRDFFHKASRLGLQESIIIMNGVFYIDGFLDKRLHRVRWTLLCVLTSNLKSQHRLTSLLPSMRHLQGRMLWHARKRTRTFGVLLNY